MDHLTSSYRASREQLAVAVHQNQALSREGILERLFTFLFSGLIVMHAGKFPLAMAMMIGGGAFMVGSLYAWLTSPLE